MTDKIIPNARNVRSAVQALLEFFAAMLDSNRRRSDHGEMLSAVLRSHQGGCRNKQRSKSTPRSQVAREQTRFGRWNQAGYFKGLHSQLTDECFGQVDSEAYL